MRCRTRVWLATVTILALAASLGTTTWAVARHTRTDADERALEDRVARRVREALAPDPRRPADPAILDELHRQLEEVRDLRRREAEATREDRIALGVLRRDLARLEARLAGEATGDPTTGPGTDRGEGPEPGPAAGAGKEPAPAATGAAARSRPGDESPEPEPGDGDGVQPTRFRGVEPARNSMIIIAPDQTFAFELGPEHFDDGICLLSNLSGADYVLKVPAPHVGHVLVDGRPLEGPLAEVGGGVTIQATRPVSIMVRPGRIPEPKPPDADG